MKSLEKLFRFGPGPSSSHTIGPAIAARSFRRLLENENVDLIQATLYGSLALTGGGHKTDVAIRQTFAPCPTKIVFDATTKTEHPLSFSFEAFSAGRSVLLRHYASLGGGEITSTDDLAVVEKDIYPFKDFNSIKEYMAVHHLKTLKDFCLQFEDSSIDAYLADSLHRMFACLEKGLLADSLIPADGNPRLQWTRFSGKIVKAASQITDLGDKRRILISGYAYAVGESSASGEEVVTAPTCGSSGVLPSVLYYEYHDRGLSFDKVKDALYAAGVFGNIVKQNASIAGAIGGCQAEIGTASSMASAALCDLEGLSLFQEEYAAECAMEHFLGLSCDPVDGFVIIPCIERTGMSALRAYDAFLYAKYLSPLRRNQVSFDNVVEAMKLTGDSLAQAYKETAQGGLAEILNEKTK